MNAREVRRLRRQILALCAVVLAGNGAAVLRACTHRTPFRMAASAIMVASVVALVIAAHLRRELLAVANRRR